MTLDDLAAIADGSLEASNIFTKLRVLAERQVAIQYLFDGDEYKRAAAREQLAERGWSSHRINNAERYTQLSLLDIEKYTTTATIAHKEAHANQLRALAPIPEKPEHKSLAAAYSTPPIDVQIAREFGLEESDTRAELITTSLQGALTQMPNPKHAYVWTKYHGIQDDGTMGERWTFQGIAASMSVTREYAESLYYRASSQVFQRIATDALNQLRNQ